MYNSQLMRWTWPYSNKIAYEDLGGREDAEPAEPPLLKKEKNFTRSREIQALGLYPYFRPISSAQDTEVIIRGQKVLMLGSTAIWV